MVAGLQPPPLHHHHHGRRIAAEHVHFSAAPHPPPAVWPRSLTADCLVWQVYATGAYPRPRFGAIGAILADELLVWGGAPDFAARGRGAEPTYLFSSARTEVLNSPGVGRESS